MKKIITLIYLFFAACTTLWAQNNVITYTASEKLEEVTANSSSGLHTNTFNINIASHTFIDNTGIITFEGEVTSIGDNAFFGCSSLTSITIPNSVTSIGNSAFYGCSSLPIVNNIRYADTYLVEVTYNKQSTYTIRSGTKWIGYNAFGNCTNLTSITIPNSVTSIGDYAFYRCSSLTSITIPESVTSIGNYAFKDCSSLTSITIPNSVTSIGHDAFYGCSGLTSITIPNSVTNIGRYAFGWCSGLTSITIPNSVTSIGEWAFSGCSGLTSITIPNSVTSIGYDAFGWCSGLTSITCHAEVPPICGENVFEYVTRTIPLYVPASSIPLYQAAEQWNEFDIQPLLVTTDSIAADTTQLSWMPVDSASMYQLRIYSEQIGLDTTLYIAADSTNGGISKILAPTQRRAHRVTMDAGGSVIIITIEPNSGTTTTTPFVVTVSTPSTEKIDIQFEMTVLQGTNILREEVGNFTLNSDSTTGLESVFYPTNIDSQHCYDIYGHSYPQTLWNNLPAGIYVIYNGGKVVKIMK